MNPPLKIYELKCTSYLKQNIPFKQSFNIISKYISFAMSQNDELKNLHNQTSFKYYTFDSFYEIELDKIYKQGNTYSFHIRSLDENFINILSKSLRENIDNEHFQIIQTNKQYIKQCFINELYTLTPTIISTENNMYWTLKTDGDILKLKKQLHDNLEKKYYDFYGKKLKSEQNFIQLIEIKNKVPQSIYIQKNDKEIRFFGNKFRIIPNEDETSQKLAFIALGAGLGEKNSFGGGFCSYRENRALRGVIG